MNYIENQPSALETLDESMCSNLNCAAFFVEIEKNNKIKIATLLALPLRRLSGYYLDAQVHIFDKFYSDLL
jgi:hypothetical protein